MPDIFQSLYNHDLPNIIKYLERGGDINAVDEEGCPLLVRAIMLEHHDVSMHQEVLAPREQRGSIPEFPSFHE